MLGALVMLGSFLLTFAWVVDRRSRGFLGRLAVRLLGSLRLDARLLGGLGFRCIASASRITGLGRFILR